MPPSPQFLVVDDNADSRFLLVKTLLRKFPLSVIHETPEASGAIALASANRLDAVIAHRAADVDGISLVRALRESNVEVPIVMVSGIDRSKPAIAAGATAFLSYDEWLRIGSIVASLLPPPPPGKSDPPTDRSTTGR